MFKPGDKVHHKHSIYKAPRTVAKTDSRYVYFEREGTGGYEMRDGQGQPNFVLIESAPTVIDVMGDNPCIMPEVIKRRIKPHSSLRMNGTTILQNIIPYSDGVLSIGGSVYTSDHLRDFARQLNEIADVLEEK